MKRWLWIQLVLLSVLVCSPSAAAEQTSSDKLFEEGVQALEREDYGRAVLLFEALADRGVTHPDVSYNRGLAYFARVMAKQGRPGDLGRAAAGFEEALLARASDEGAARALDAVRAEVARTTPKANRSDVDVSPSLDRLIVGLLPEGVWAWGALIGSLMLSVGLVLRRRKAGAGYLAGMIAAPVGALAMVLFGLSTGWSWYLRQTTVPAVVVVAEARMLDENGTALPSQAPIPEAARVDVLGRKVGLAKIRYGQREGWTHAASLRELR